MNIIMHSDCKVLMMEQIKYYSESMLVEMLGKKDGKYYFKFPFLDIPVEVGDQFYRKYLEN